MVVAGTQAGALRAEVGKGSVRTAVGHGLVDPKQRGNPFERCTIFFFSLIYIYIYWSYHVAKGNQVKIPEPKRGAFILKKKKR